MTNIPKVDALVLDGLDAKLRELRDLVRELETYRHVLAQPQTSLIGQDDSRIAAALVAKENKLRALWTKKTKARAKPTAETRSRRKPAEIRALTERSLRKLGEATVIQVGKHASISDSLARKYINQFIKEGTVTKNGSVYSFKKKTDSKANSQ